MKKKFRRPPPSSIHNDLAAHVMSKVTDAATDVVQLVDTMDEALSLYRLALGALLIETILRTAPPGTSRAELLLGAKAISHSLPLHVASVLKEFTDDEIARRSIAGRLTVD